MTHGMHGERGVFGQIHSGEPTFSLPTDLPRTERALTPWIDRWTFDRGGKRWRVAVRVTRLNGAEEYIDAREWVETLGDAERWPDGTAFETIIEEVKNG